MKNHPIQAALKRAVDVIAAAAVLSACLPVFGVVAAWVEFGDQAARLLRLPNQWSMAVVGWPALLISWLVITVLDPTAKRSDNRSTVQRP